MIDSETWSEALAFVSRRSPLRVISDSTVTKGIPYPARPSDVLHGNLSVRPLDTLRMLGLASAMDVEGQVLEASSFWAVLRYLAAFDAKVGADRLLTLSATGEKVRANQRRVLSEDLGIAFGLTVASEWLRQGLPAGALIWIADVDNLGAPFTSLTDASTTRPDYVVMAQAPGADEVKMGLVECKGTRSASRVQARLSRACAQVLPSGEHEKLPSLAVSGVFSRSRTEVRALEIMTGSGRFDVEDERAREVRRAAMFGLALYSENLPGAESMEAERRTSSLNPARDDARRVRSRGLGSRGSRPDLRSEGVTSALTLPRGSIQVHQGVDQEMDERIAQGDIDGAAAAAERRRTSEQAFSGASVEAAGVSMGSDGSTLAVTLA